MIGIVIVTHGGLADGRRGLCPRTVASGRARTSRDPQQPVSSAGLRGPVAHEAEEVPDCRKRVEFLLKIKDQVLQENL